ncbi:MAG: hypothetical protein ACUZ77_03190 [Candidatus Brocadiales bacterium]
MKIEFSAEENGLYCRGRVPKSACKDEALKELGRREDKGQLYFGEKDPNLLAEERKALAHVDSVWDACLDGKSTLEAFRVAAKDWHAVIVSLYSLQDQKV